MDREATPGLIAASIGILMLLTLAVLVYRDMQALEEMGEDPEPLQSAFLLLYEEDTEDPENAGGGIDEEEKKRTVPATEVTSGLKSGDKRGDAEKEHCILFVGDSRTVGMQIALKKYRGDDLCLSVAKVGEGCAWFCESGKEEMSALLRERPDLPVVLNLGVNDPDQTERYLSVYRQMMQEFPDTIFWFLSVGPIDHSLMAENEFSSVSLDLITQERIDALNEAFREAFPDRFLDLTACLKESGFDSPDGIHYSPSTYLKIHDFVVEALF